MTTNQSPVWFITGCSTGFGRALAQHALKLGYSTVITARDTAQIADLAVGHEAQALVLELDVTRPEQVTAAVAAAEARFGRIDVLVNNAGIGYFGSLEASDETEVRRMFEINVWGLASMTRAVLPGMRGRRSGAIINVSSIGGIAALPSLSFYNASKFAVEALSESLSKEVAHLGIKVMLVEPGPFRTDWAGRSANQAGAEIADYEATAKAYTDTIRGYNGKQPGDPKRAAAAIVQAIESAQSPLRLLLGKAALAGARAKVELLRTDFETWAHVTEAADFPTGE